MWAYVRPDANVVTHEILGEVLLVYGRHIDGVGIVQGLEHRLDHGLLHGLVIGVDDETIHQDGPGVDDGTEPVVVLSSPGDGGGQLHYKHGG